MTTAWTSASLSFNRAAMPHRRAPSRPTLSGEAVAQPSSSEAGDPQAKFLRPSDVSFDCADAFDAISKAAPPKQKRHIRGKLARMVIPSLSDKYYAGGGTETFTDGRSSIFWWKASSFG